MAGALGGREMHTFWSENTKGGDHSEGIGIDGRIILEWILEKGGKMWTGSSGSEQGPVAGPYVTCPQCREFAYSQKPVEIRVNFSP
jgi:hypothetical protein